MALPLPKLALWKVIEGILYMLTTIVIMAYPQVLDIFNFSDKEFEAADYKIAQMGAVGPFVIGCIYVEHGLMPYFNEYIVPLMMKNKKPILVPESPLSYTIVTVFLRIINVPI